jgi:hypothetical protein
MYENNVNSNCPEFGYELLSAVPYAYNLFLKGKLESTISAYDTSCLYFFSPNHTESNCQRSWNNMKKLWNNNFPNIQIHRKDLDWNLFSPPPFKEHYKSSAIKFEKETIVIFNRYNYEWGKPPINFLDLKTLEKLFDMLQDKYQIVYINIKGHKKYYDGVEPLDLKDDQLLLKYPKVIGINDLIKQYPDLTYNEVQLRVFANCEKYISSNGGQLILSAYFGGENIIFSKKCRELDPEVNSFYRWYYRLGGGVFQHVNNYDDLVELVRQKWVDNKPLFNILIRTSGRPNYFQGCIESIYKQKYKNWNIIIGVDDPKSEKYTKSVKGRTIHYNYKPTKEMVKPNSNEYGNFFIYNLYLNDLQNQVKNGYIIYLDDDDVLYDENSLDQLSEVINGEDQLVIWRVQFPNRLVPSDENFGKKPVMRDISGIGFTFHNKYKINWEPFKRGDYRVAKQLYEKVPKVTFLNKIITKLQREIEDGLGRRDDIILQVTNVVERVKEDVISLKPEETNTILPKKKTIEFVNKKMDYEKINLIFNKSVGYKTNNNTQNNRSQHDLKKNTDLIQKMLPKNKRKFL